MSELPLTIGVPVYNGADLIDESMACLARQTFRDFKVLIFDNASTDGTSDKAYAWAQRDTRFIHVLQPKNVGGTANFRDALLAADTPWYMWRADDDLSDDNYIETLFEISKRTGADLAVSTIVSTDLDGGRRRVYTPPAGDPATVMGRVHTLLHYHPSWFYGVWRREAARRAFLPVYDAYPYAFASDHVTLYGPILDGAFRTTTDTQFYQRFRRTASTPRRQTRTPFKVMLEVRQAFKHELRRMREEREIGLAEQIALQISQPFYLYHVLPSYRKMARTGLREMLGMAGQKSTSWHVQRHE